MKTYTIWDIQAKEGKDHESGEALKTGDKVRITRQVTYVYEIDISDVLDQWDEPGVLGEGALTVKEYIEDERDNNADYISIADEEDDVIITVELL